MLLPFWYFYYMTLEELKRRNFEQEFEFTATRSSGPGGQNVNKVNTKIALRFDVANSQKLNSKEKQILLAKPSKHLLDSGILLFHSQEYRSQLHNKEDAIAKFYNYLTKAFTPIKKLKKTKPPKPSQEKRLENKTRLSAIKQARKKDGLF
jgi:ribosome-associated protein